MWYLTQDTEFTSCTSDLDCGIGCDCYKGYCYDRDDVDILKDDSESNDADIGSFQFDIGETNENINPGGSGISGNLISYLVNLFARGF